MQVLKCKELQNLASWEMLVACEIIFQPLVPSNLSNKRANWIRAGSWVKCCAVLFSHLGSLLAAWQHNVQAFTWIQMQLWHCVMITIYNLGGHEIVKLDTTITQCYPVIHILFYFLLLLCMLLHLSTEVPHVDFLA